MSLPPGFLDELRSRSSIAQVVGRKVMWDQRKSNQAKGDMWAPCPFHQEKTASFHVDDQKGYYYCFGCHAKGDAIGFVKETENVSFMEAVEILAREAGMQMPARDPRAQEKADKRTKLADVMEQAVQFFRLQLKTNAGAAARDYLAARGFDEKRLDRWEIGFAPEGWQNLWDHLSGKNVAEDLILGAGLAKPSNQGKKPYDTFRNRIMFPIRDPRGRCIAFGGRAMDPADNAKYLNSPETELFDKGRSLYNHGPAREAAGKGQPLIVAEGYMDVIALASAGFDAAVAPLGTAVTETQLELLWRISPEPVIALDGDAAGLRAAMRLIDLALPYLSSERTLKFGLLPEGEDPDDFIKRHGAGAFGDLVTEAVPFVRMVWERETKGQKFDSPESKAALDARLRKITTQIGDQNLRYYYGQAFAEFKKVLFRKDWAPEFKFKKRKDGATVSARNSALARDHENRMAEQLRERAILASCIYHPDAATRFVDELEMAEFSSESHRRISLAVAENCSHNDRVQLQSVLTQIVGADAISEIVDDPHIRIIPSVRDLFDTDVAVATIAEAMGKLKTDRGLRMELEEAEDAIFSDPNDAVVWRLTQAANRFNEALHMPSPFDESEDVDWGAKPLDLEQLLSQSQKKGRRDT